MAKAKQTLAVSRLNELKQFHKMIKHNTTKMKEKDRLSKDNTGKTIYTDQLNMQKA